VNSINPGNCQPGHAHQPQAASRTCLVRAGTSRQGRARHWTALGRGCGSNAVCPPPWVEPRTYRPRFVPSVRRWTRVITGVPLPRRRRPWLTRDVTAILAFSRTMAGAKQSDPKTTSQPSYLRHLLSALEDRSTRSTSRRNSTGTSERLDWRRKAP